MKSFERKGDPNYCSHKNSIRKNVHVRFDQAAQVSSAQAPHFITNALTMGLNDPGFMQKKYFQIVLRNNFSYNL